MTHTDLRACPFCGAALRIRNSLNAYGQCETAGCWMNARKVIVPLDDPRQVSDWNTRHPEYDVFRVRLGCVYEPTRTPDTAPSQSADLIAEVEERLRTAIDAQNRLDGGEYDNGIMAVIRCEDVQFYRAVATALRAAEAENAELTAFRNGYKDTIRRLQDSVSAAEAREQKLREALEPFADVAWELEGEPDGRSLWEHPATVDLTAGHLRAAAATVKDCLTVQQSNTALRALGGDNGDV